MTFSKMCRSTRTKRYVTPFKHSLPRCAAVRVRLFLVRCVPMEKIRHMLVWKRCWVMAKRVVQLNFGLLVQRRRSVPAFSRHMRLLVAAPVLLSLLAHCAPVAKIHPMPTWRSLLLMGKHAVKWHFVCRVKTRRNVQAVSLFMLMHVDAPVPPHLAHCVPMAKICLMPTWKIPLRTTKLVVSWHLSFKLLMTIRVRRTSHRTRMLVVVPAQLHPAHCALVEKNLFIRMLSQSMPMV
mmetsp:Transcript_17319/g.17512  ORF Transcript_17319/g.17512 Transcript_17319/m.17512 type:complete len:236 (+) Transcript_17319:439-1146(+)